MIQQTAELQYKIECHVSGVVDGDSGPLNYDLDEKRARLRTFTQSWKTLQWAETPPETSLSAFYRSGPVWLNITDDRRAIMSTQLASKARGILAGEPMLHQLPFRIAPLHIHYDYSQDLLILSELEYVQVHSVACTLTDYLF